MKTSIFLRSYAADIGWVPYALRSLNRFVTGISEIIISVPKEDFNKFRALDLTREKLVVSQVVTRDGYMDQQRDKLYADFYTDSPLILYWDSDVIATRPFSPGDLTIDGKPRCLITPFDKLVNADGSQATPWRPVIEKALGHPVTHEAMRAHPFMTHRSALAGLREYMFSLHGITVGQYIERQPNRAFSEFNVLNNWALHHRPDLFSWWDTEKRGVPESFVKQHWSWSGLTDAERGEMEKALA